MRATSSRPLTVTATASRTGRSRPLEVTARHLTRLGRHRRFGGVVANLESRLVIPMLAVLPAILEAGGWVVVSGILESERAPVLSAAAHAGLDLRDDIVEEGWWTAWLGRSTC
jgi:ribosomal protein L11 methylase PrmA